LIRTVLAGLAVVCVSSTAWGGERFAAPTGQLGAGIVFSPEQRGRAHAELGFYHHSDPGHLNSFPTLLGFGFKVIPELELEAMLPVGFLEYGDGGSSSEAAVAAGNLHLGVSYLHGDGGLRLKVGAAVEFGPWTNDFETESAIAIVLGHPVGGGQDLGLWAPEVLSFVAPGRIEYGDEVVFGADFAVGLHIPDVGDNAVTVQLAPGLGAYVSDSVLLGLRIPFTIIPTSLDDENDDAALVALEPYARFNIGKGFLNARFTINLDEPYGFSFEEDKIWGLHVGGGVAF
jgi:hypothetical protein